VGPSVARAPCCPIERLRLKLRLVVRAEKDSAAAGPLPKAAECQARGDLEAAVSVFEQVDVHDLSKEVSQDVFGRWSDASSRLGQAARRQTHVASLSVGRALALAPSNGLPHRE
jgi:hypothetical protein